MVKRLSRLLEFVNGWLAAVGYAAVFAMMAIVTADVLLRFFFSKPIAWGYDIVNMLMAATIWPVMAKLEEEGGHLKAEILSNIIGKKGVLATDMGASVLGFVVIGLIAIANFTGAYISTSIRETTGGIVGIQVYPFKWLVFISLVLFCLRFLINIVIYSSNLLHKQQKGES